MTTIEGPEVEQPVPPGDRAAPGVADGGDAPDRTQRKRFFWVTLAITLAISGAFLVRILVYTGGHVVYVIDDPGIHLSMARNLAEHGTWGVAPGVYESASSSPAWTLMLAGVVKTVSPLGSVAPLIGNLVAAAWILWIFASRQRFPVLARGNVGSWLFVLVLPVFGLFLPGLAFTGMEHTVHTAVTLQVLVLLALLVDGRATPARWVTYFALLFLASAVRLETMFLAAGCGMAFLFATSERLGGRAVAARWPIRRRVVAALGTAAASAVPVLVIGTINRAFDRRFFPNSIVAKSALGQEGSIVPTWDEVLGRLNQDVLLGLLVVAAVVYLVFVATGFQGRNPVFALAFVVTAVAHLMFAEIGWWERYQAYLVVAGIFLALRIGSEVVVPRWREATLAGFALALVVFSLGRVTLLPWTPLAASNTYRQQYQIGRFMHEYYDGKPIAVQDLGYISFLHDGPVVDLNGLGSHDVLEQLRADTFDEQAKRDLIRERGVEAIALYADAYAFRLPEGWIGVGEWKLGQKKVSPLYSTVTFYAPNERLARRLERNLRAFRAQLPDGVRTLDRRQMIERSFARLGGLPESPTDLGAEEDESPLVPGGAP